MGTYSVTNARKRQELTLKVATRVLEFREP